MSSGLTNKQGRESAFGDSSTILPDGIIGADDRNTLVGSYPIGVFGSGQGGFSVDIWMPHMVFPRTRKREEGGTGKGSTGSGSFKFEVSDQTNGGNVLVHLIGVLFEFENKADKSYRDLIGENTNPKAQVENEDDGIDVV